jgi:hypothetical protein
MVSKRTIVIIAVTGTVISLIITFGQYYGIDRYFILQYKNPKGLIERYSGLPKASEDRTIISLSFDKKQIKKLLPTINSILDQTVKVDQIIMVVPDGTDVDTLPGYVTDVANIQPAGKDYGKGNKLIPVLLREKEQKTVIIALDTGWIYGKDFVETMITNMQEHDGKVLMEKSGSALLVKPEYFDYDVIDRRENMFDNKWFLNKAKESKIIKIGETYKLF